MLKNGQSMFSIGIILTLSGLVGKLLGFIRDILLFRDYGISAMTDAFFLAMMIPNILIGVFTHSADGAIIGQYSRISSTDSRYKADRHFSNVVNILTVIGLMISLFTYCFPYIILKWFAPDFDEYQIMYGVKFLRIFSFLGLFHIFYCFFSSYNTFYNHAIVRSILSFTTNIIVVAVLFFYYDKEMLLLSWSYVVGGILAAILPIVSALRIGFKYTFTFSLSDVEFRVFIKNFIPIAGIAALYNTNTFVERFLAAGMPVGSISALNYGFKLISIFDSMLVVGIGVIIIPYFSKIKANKNFDNIKNTITEIIVAVMLIFTPLAIYGILFSYDIVFLVYGRGHFDVGAIELISGVFACYALQIVFVTLQMILSRIFYAMENTITPLKISIAAVIVNILCSITLSKYIGINGIALGTTVATAFSVIVYIYILWNSNSVCPKILSSYKVSRYLWLNFLIALLYKATQTNISYIYTRLGIGLLLILGVYLGLFYMYKAKLVEFKKYANIQNQDSE